MPQIIASESWQSRATVRHARALLGKFLVRAGHAPHMITEVEAYDGERDLACHARAGRTRRTEVLYGAGGVWYVYLCYGIHEMLNLVVGPKDWPAAILIRGLDGVSGPGRVTKKLGINRTLNGGVAALGELWIEDHGIRVPAKIINAGPRVGVDFAGPVWSKKPWRFRFDPKELRTKRRVIKSETRGRARSPSAP
jgi:DNA-3-methyladenine glycosylase